MPDLRRVARADARQREGLATRGPADDQHRGGGPRPEPGARRGIRVFAPGGRRRHGGGVPVPRSGPQAAGGGEGAGAGSRRRRRGPRAVHPRGQVRGRAVASQRGARVRGRRDRRPQAPLHRDAVRRGPLPGPVDGAAPALDRARRAADHRRSGRRPRRGARARAAAPRREARQRAARGRLGPRVRGRLRRQRRAGRHLARSHRQPHGHRPRGGHADLHEPGAGGGRAADRQERRLQPRRDGVRAAGGRAAVQGDHGDGLGRGPPARHADAGGAPSRRPLARGQPPGGPLRRQASHGPAHGERRRARHDAHARFRDRVAAAGDVLAARPGAHPHPARAGHVRRRGADAERAHLHAAGIAGARQLAVDVPEPVEPRPGRGVAVRVADPADPGRGRARARASPRSSCSAWARPAAWCGSGAPAGGGAPWWTSPPTTTAAAGWC